MFTPPSMVALCREKRFAKDAASGDELGACECTDGAYFSGGGMYVDASGSDIEAAYLFAFPKKNEHASLFILVHIQMLNDNEIIHIY